MQSRIREPGRQTELENYFKSVSVNKNDAGILSILAYYS